MPAHVVPTLAAMAEVYRLPREGGASSTLFRRYLSLINEGAPLQPYNPMAGAVTVPTIEELRELDAERVVAQAASEMLSSLGWNEPMTLCIGVSHPGVWTERVTTEAEHRLLPRSGRRGGELVLLWAGEPIDSERLAVEARAQAARGVRRRRMGSPRTVRQAFDQEGWTYAVAGAPDPSPAPETQRAVYDALAAVGDDVGLDTMVALLYGDEAADRLGWRALGLPERSGYAVGLHHHLQRRDQHAEVRA